MPELAALSEYENDAPVACRWTVLDLLSPRWGDNTSRELHRWRHAPAHVEVGHHRDFGDSVYERFLVDPKLAEGMLLEGLLEGTPHWGYTEYRVLRISPAGERALEEKWEELGGADYYGHGTGGIPPSSRWLRRRI